MCHVLILRSAVQVLSFPKVRLKAADRALYRAERGIALISRCRPLNAKSEQVRLMTAWQSGRCELPRWSYAKVPDLSELRRLLDEALQPLPADDPIAELYVQRATELELETRIVEAIGRRDLARLSTARFGGYDPQAEVEADQLARHWCKLKPPPAGQLIPTDDPADERSLYSRMGQTIGRMRLPVQIRLSDELLAAAATGEALIFVATGRQLSKMAIERIVLHEVQGHALPRYNAAKQSLGLFSVGSARGNDEQEGYALYLEERDGLMDAARKRELALRHIAASTVHAGADWVESMRVLLDLGATLEEAMPITSRVHRAGGLAREFVYLPALCRVRRAIAEDQGVLRWICSGRLSLEAIALLRAEEFPLEASSL